MNALYSSARRSLGTAPQRSLRGAILWDSSGLVEPEQRLFDELSVFAVRRTRLGWGDAPSAGRPSHCTRWPSVEYSPVFSNRLRKQRPFWLDLALPVER
jgi:hypothetical protein